MVTVGDFKSKFPEFSSMPESIVQFWLDFATSLVNADLFAEKIDYGICLLTAHFLTLVNKDSNAPGAVTSESVGELSRSYASLESKSMDELGQTTYGSMLRLLIKTLVITPRVISC